MDILKKKYVVMMPDGSRWAVPVRVIAEDYAGYYYKKGAYGSFAEALAVTEEYFEDELEIKDWAQNNMNWEDVEEHAKLYAPPSNAVDYQEGWCNGEVEICEEDNE